MEEEVTDVNVCYEYVEELADSLGYKQLLAPSETPRRPKKSHDPFPAPSLRPGLRSTTRSPQVAPDPPPHRAIVQETNFKAPLIAQKKEQTSGRGRGPKGRGSGSNFEGGSPIVATSDAHPPVNDAFKRPNGITGASVEKPFNSPMLNFPKLGGLIEEKKANFVHQDVIPPNRTAALRPKFQKKSVKIEVDGFMKTPESAKEVPKDEGRTPRPKFQNHPMKPKVEDKPKLEAAEIDNKNPALIRVESDGAKFQKNSVKTDEKEMARPDAENNKPEEDWSGKEITRCICGFVDEYDKMVECEKCSVWQHFFCLRLEEGTDTSGFLCEVCDPQKELPWTAAEAREKMKNILEVLEWERLEMNKLKELPAPKKRTLKRRKSIVLDVPVAKKTLKRAKSPLPQFPISIKNSGVSENTFSDKAKQMILVCGRNKDAFTGIIVFNGCRKMPVGGKGAEGIVAINDLPKNAAVIEIVGRISLPEETEVDDYFFNPYVFVYDGLGDSKDDRLCIDAQTVVNDGRNVRRLCSPNAVIRHVVIDGELKFYVVTIQELAKGSEIFVPFDHGFRPISVDSCHCIDREKCSILADFRGPGHRLPLQEAEIEENTQDPVVKEQKAKSGLDPRRRQSVGGHVVIKKSSNNKRHGSVPLNKVARLDTSVDVQMHDALPFIMKGLGKSEFSLPSSVLTVHGLEKKNVNTTDSLPSTPGSFIPSTGGSSQRKVSTASLASSSATSSRRRIGVSHESPLTHGLGTSKSEYY